MTSKPDTRHTVKEFSPFTIEYGNQQEELRQTQSLVNALDLQEILETLPFDPLALYCVKTGQPRGKRTYEQLYALAALHNKEQSQFLLGLLQEDGCAVHWSQTDSELVERLRLVDPVGYFIYAAGFLVAHHYRVYNPKATTARATPDPELKTIKQNARERRGLLFKQKIISYAALKARFEAAQRAHTGTANTGENTNANLPTNADDFAFDDDLRLGNAPDMALLHVANGHLSRFLAYDPSLLDLPFKTIQEVLHSLEHGNLYHTLSHCFKRWLSRETNSFDPSKMFEALQNGGASQFKKPRKKTNQMRRTEELLAELAELGVDVSKFREPTMARSAYNNKTPTQQMRETVKAQEPARVILSTEIKAGSFAARFGAKKAS